MKTNTKNYTTEYKAIEKQFEDVMELVKTDYTKANKLFNETKLRLETFIKNVKGE